MQKKTGSERGEASDGGERMELWGSIRIPNANGSDDLQQPLYMSIY